MAQDTPSCVVVGGGPAGAAAARLLASWGHRVTLFDKRADVSRGLAESIPPSTHKLLEQIGVADAVRRAGFFRTRGNTVWWASRARRVETFGEGDSALGYQVFRPEFDRLLLDCAVDAGVDVRQDVQVRRVAVDDPDAASIEYGAGGEVATLRARFVLDCSGRTGILGRRFRMAEPGFRTCALVGVWRRQGTWGLPDDTHTAVETFPDGWAWSVPTNASTRHVGVMVGRAPAGDASERTLTSGYRLGLGKAKEIDGLVRSATLERVWACDASLYSATAYAGPHHFLVGDAGSFIDPLSSFGVKKALASAWVAAVATHTALTYPDRAAIALEFFTNWEQRVYATHLRRTRQFSGAAFAQHSSMFWRARAQPEEESGSVDSSDGDFARDPLVQRAFETFRAAPRIQLALAPGAALEQRPVIRGHEIVLEPALAGGMRYVANVDLLTLAQMAPHHAQVPDLFEAYCRTCPPVPLPNVVGGLSLLVARGILHERA